MELSKVAAIIGWRRLIRQEIAYWSRWYAIRDWFLQIWFCHRNARVIIDFERRMAAVLTTCTRGMSKPYYTAEAMVAEINDFINESAEEAIDDWCKDHSIDRAKIEAGE